MVMSKLHNLPCGCQNPATHTEGEQLITCTHQRWIVKAHWEISYESRPAAIAEEALQQATRSSRIANDELPRV